MSDPLLEGRDLARAEVAIRSVAVALQPGAWSVAAGDLDEDHDQALRAKLHASLGQGRPGAVLLHTELGDCASAHALLGDTLRTIGEVDLDAGLYVGLAGIGYAAAQLRAKGYDDDDLARTLETIDGALADQTARWPEDGEYELTFGLAGVGAYWLARLPAPRAAQALEQIILELATRAVHGDVGVVWRSPHAFLELGMMHGMAGAIGLLALAAESGIGRREASALLEPAVEALLAHERIGADGGRARFPAWARGSQLGEAPNRGWGSGDLGIAAALVVAARATGERAWERRGVEVAHAVVGAGVGALPDVGLRDGLAGAAHTLHRIARATGDEVCFDAARTIFRDLLDRQERAATEGKGVAGVLAWHDVGWRRAPGLLSGAAGVALALLSATSDAERAWDLALLQPGRRAQPGARLFIVD